ncbi:radical SAM protein [Chloroflexota bacterium]
MIKNTENKAQQENLITPRLHVVAWEITRSCNLYCAHCRGSADSAHYSGELTTGECFQLVDQIMEVGKPILILTGGEPLMRNDVFEIGKYASSRGLRVVMGTNGTLISRELAAELKNIPIARVGVSLDFPSAKLQDAFRGQKGTLEAALAGIANARNAGIEIQINSTITSKNVDLLDELIALALDVGAVAFHPFLLVPTGRGKDLESLELPPEQYEETLHKIHDKQQELGDRLFFKPTDVPHYMRVVKQRLKEKPATVMPGRSGHPANVIKRGCLAGTGFAFVSYLGKVKGCGYLDVEAGDVRKDSFAEIWNNSPLFQSLRNLANLKGKCGECEYKRICGGCRARAYEATEDYLEAEPYCIYQPHRGRLEE